MLWPIIVYFFATLAVVGVMVAIPHLLGERHRERGTDVPYESGMMPTGEAWIRFDVKYYLVAMFFVIFDVEAVFIFAWGVSVRETGWAGYAEVTVFIGVLGAALLYLWKAGALDWAARPGTTTKEPS